MAIHIMCRGKPLKPDEMLAVKDILISVIEGRLNWGLAEKMAVAKLAEKEFIDDGALR